MSENYGAFLLDLVCVHSRNGGADGYAELRTQEALELPLLPP